MEGIVIAIIAANCIVSMKGLNDEVFFRKHEFHVGSIRSGDQLRMFSSAFLHADIPHLAFNMLTLYFFADVVVESLGTITFTSIYLASLVCGNLLTLYFHKDNYSYRAVGASGAVTGVLYSAILLNPDGEIYFILFPFAGIPAYIFGICYLLYTIYGMKSRRDNIGHDAHFGGAIGGYVLTLFARPTLLTDNVLIVILLAVPIVILFFLARSGKL